MSNQIKKLNNSPVGKESGQPEPSGERMEELNSRITAGGKKFDIVPVNGYNMFKIQFTSGGQLPESLQGTFTKREYALKAIDLYLERGK